MKKIFLAIVLSASAQIVDAQTDMITALKAADGLTYTEYWNIVPVAGGKNTIGEKRWVTTLHTVKNKFGQVVGFNCVDNKDTSEKRVRYDYMYYQFDHYTHPSYMTSPANHAWAMINGVLFQLEHFTSITSFDIDAMWFPTVPKDKASDPMWKGSKMADMKSADLMKMVTDYFAEMKKIQEANPYSEDSQIQVAEMKFLVDSTKLAWDNTNAAYWNSDEGKKKLEELRGNSGKPTRKTIKNTANAGLTVIYDNGATSHINPGASSTFPCSENVYYAVKDEKGNYTKKGQLITAKDADCGGTLNAAGGN